MFWEKRRRFYILCMTLIGITAIFGGTFFFFHNRDHAPRQEAQAHIGNLFSLSGKLTPDEEQAFLSTTQALGKIMDQQLKNGHQNLPFISDEELERIQKHTVALMQENPKLAIHAHGPGEDHKHGYETDPGENQKWIQEELADINAAIEEVEASNASASAKEALLSVLEHRRSFLMNHEKDAAELDEKFREFYQQDPTIIGVEKNHITGEYTPIPPNRLIILKHRTHSPDGTFEEDIVPQKSHATDPEVGQLLNEYLEALETLPPWEVPPPPEHKDLQLTILTKDVYLNEAGENITDAARQTPEDSSTFEMPETSEDTSTDITSAYPEPLITAEEVEEWQGALEEISDSTDIEIEAIRELFEDTIGIPLDRFLEMTDAEIEAEFNKYLSPSEADLEKQVMPAAPMDLSIEENFKAELRSQFSQKRYNQAMQTLERYGPKEGIRRLKDVDPEMSTHLERRIQQQKEE